MLQTIDMNQDNHFEDALKMRNLLQEFEQSEGEKPITIVGFRENIYTGMYACIVLGTCL
jgi:callose synthase